MAIELLRSFLQQATATGARSTVLTDLRWAMGIIAATFVVAIHYAAPGWVLVFLAIIMAISCTLYFAAYVYFGITSPDSLRSERFTLSKMAIEKSIMGDNLSGLIDPMDKKRAAELPPGETKKEAQ